MMRASISALGVTCILATTAVAQSGSAVCAKMIRDGRANGMSQSDCMCNYRVAEAVLDDDIQALLFESWSTGKNNMAALEQLPRPKRVEKQFRKMQRTLKKNCS